MGLKMNSEFYNVYIDDNCISENMPLQFALILTKAVYSEFYAEPNLKVTIERVNNNKPAEVEEIHE